MGHKRCMSEARGWWETEKRQGCSPGWGGCGDEWASWPSEGAGRGGEGPDPWLGGERWPSERGRREERRWSRWQGAPHPSGGSGSWWGGPEWGAAAPWHEQRQEEAECHDYILEAARAHKYTLVWLHSCHGRAAHVEPFMEELREHAFSVEHLRVVAPCAPKRHCQDGDWSSHQWFEYLTESMHEGYKSQDDAQWAQLRQQRARLLRLLEDELERLPEDGRLVLGGLSQGASMALDMLLHVRSPLVRKLKGVIARRGMLQRETVHDLPRAFAERRLVGFPVLSTHGVADDWVPIHAAHRSYGFLAKVGASFEFRRIEGLYHTGYSEEETLALIEFMRRHLCVP